MRFALPSFVVAVLLALAVGRFGLARMPQVVSGDDALSVAFGDAKSTISAAMVHKADSYFHGGIDMECKEHHDHHDDHDDHAHHDNRAPQPPAPSPQPSTLNPQPSTHAFDPWLWINAHVRAPEKHVHLDGGKAVEMLPWFWAAVRADPHNIEAWTTAAYAAERMMKDRALARRVLDEAKTKNPDSLEIAWTEARFVYDSGRGDVAAAEGLFENARSLGKKKCGGRLSALSEHDAEMYCHILDYLSKILATRGDRTAIRPLVEEARATGAKTPVIGWMSERLK